MLIYAYFKMGTPDPCGLKACWQEPKLSDISVHIIESPTPLLRNNRVQPRKKARKSARQEAEHVIPCSKAVLASHSEYFRTRLLSEMEAGATEFPLLVEDGEADAALAVIQTMYTGIPEDVTAAKLVTMWRIADRLQATSAALCVKALCGMDLDWDTSLMVRSKSQRSTASAISRIHVGIQAVRSTKELEGLRTCMMDA